MIDWIKNFIEENSLKWGVISHIGSDWLTWSGACEYKQEHRLILDFYAAQTVSPEDEEMIQRDVLSGRTDPETFSW